MRRLGERYVLEEPLGAGGMGSIFRGRDERLGQAVAIKVLKRAHVDDLVVRERFRREALSLSKLREAGIVAVLDFGEADGDLYTVLELVAGETLDRWMHGAMPTPDAGRIVLRILAALEICHRHGIVHRDVKPSNVIVARTGSDGSDVRVTLIDFGLARIARIGGDSIAKLTETGTVQGTPHYMAPEQCRGEDVGPASDVYSTGVLFYEMLAGASPYRGSDAATFMAQHLFVEPAPLRDVAPGVSAGIAAVVHAMLAKRAEDRPGAADAAQRLARALDGADPEAAAADSAARRHEVAGLGREARALGGGARASGASSLDGAVVVWLKDGDRSAAVRACLGATGLRCVAATSDVPPALGARDVAVVSVADRDRLRRLRGADATAPIVAVDIGSPDETTAAIRDGANDMLLGAAPDTDLVAKVRRLLERRGRGGRA